MKEADDFYKSISVGDRGPQQTLLTRQGYAGGGWREGGREGGREGWSDGQFTLQM